MSVLTKDRRCSGYNCNRKIDYRNKTGLCIHCYLKVKVAREKPKPDPRHCLKVRVVQFDRPRPWAEVVAAARPKARSAEAFCTTTLSPRFDPDIAPIIAGIPKEEE